MGWPCGFTRTYINRLNFQRGKPDFKTLQMKQVILEAGRNFSHDEEKLFYVQVTSRGFSSPTCLSLNYFQQFCGWQMPVGRQK